MIRYDNSYRQILSIAAPISFSLLIPQISFIANTIFVARLDKLAMVILGLVSIYYLLLTWMSYGLSNGLLILLSRKSGAKDERGYYEYLWHGIALGLVMILLFMIGSWWLLPAYYRFSYHDPAVINGGIDFFKIRVWGVPFMVLSQIGNIVLISQGKSRWLIPSSILANAALIFFDYGLIFGNMSMPQMGVNGAALASVLSEMVHFIIVLIIVITLKIGSALRNEIKVQWHIFQNIIRISSPLIFQYIFSIGGWLLFFNFMEHLGREQVAASHILRNFLGVLGIGAWSFASTSNTLVSNLIGQQRHSELRAAIGKLSRVALVFAAIFSIGTFIFSDEIISMFTRDAAVTAFIHEGLWVLWANSFIMVTGTIAFNGLMGMGDTKQNMIIEVCAVILYTIYIYVIVKWLDLSFFWAWTSECVYWMVLLLWSWNVLWKKTKVFN